MIWGCENNLIFPVKEIGDPMLLLELVFLLEKLLE